MFGLGFYVLENEYTKPMYADNDIEYSFECEFDNDDIHRINLVRGGINNLIGNKKNAERFLNDFETLAKVQMNNRKMVFDLFRRNRNILEKEQIETYKHQHRWNQLDQRVYKNLENFEKRRFVNLDYFTLIRRVDFNKL